MNYNFKETLQNITLGNDLSTGEAMFALESIMNGEVSSEEIASFLTAMKMKGETIEELSSFVKVMRSKSLRDDPRSIETFERESCLLSDFSTFNSA